VTFLSTQLEVKTHVSPQAHPLVAFFALAYLISWSVVPFGLFFTPGPLIAALIVVPLTQGRPRGTSPVGAPADPLASRLAVVRARGGRTAGGACGDLRSHTFVSA
jgi:hypothetical protein